MSPARGSWCPTRRLWTWPGGLQAEPGDPGLAGRDPGGLNFLHTPPRTLPTASQSWVCQGDLHKYRILLLKSFQVLPVSHRTEADVLCTAHMAGLLWLLISLSMAMLPQPLYIFRRFLELVKVISTLRPCMYLPGKPFL